jgi:hypothetical protein
MVFDEPIRTARTSLLASVFNWFIYDHRRTTRWKRLTRTAQNRFYPAVVVNRKEELRQLEDTRGRKYQQEEHGHTPEQRSKNSGSNPHR